MLSALSRKAYDKAIESILAMRGQELWLIGIDSRNELYIDICGIVGAHLLAAIQSKGFVNSDAGFKADVQNVIDLGGKGLIFFS